MKENSNITTIELYHILLVSVSTIERDLKALIDNILLSTQEVLEAYIGK